MQDGPFGPAFVSFMWQLVGQLLILARPIFSIQLGVWAAVFLSGALFMWVVSVVRGGKVNE